MRFVSVRVRNFRSFLDSGEIAFAPGFNVVVGKNNSGKSALLQALQANGAGVPHRSQHSLPTAAAPMDPVTRIGFVVEVRGPDLRSYLLRLGQWFSIPGPLNSQPWLSDPIGSIESLLKLDSLRFSLDYVTQAAGGGHWEPIELPDALRYEKGPQHLLFGVSENRRGFVFQGQGSGHTALAIHAANAFRQSVYRFEAERMKLAASRVGTSTVLAPDARNLAEVLANLSSNKVRFERYNQLVRRVFPSIKQVATSNRANDLVEVMLWQVDPATEREDLAISLADSGTGVAQVLAILYVATTAASTGPIIIDEPNSFLHPGAARELIDTLQEFPLPQVILSTHAPEVVSASRPQSLIMLRWQDGATEIEQLTGEAVAVQQDILREVGAKLSDVFGADRVLWVEGKTEELCFPSIARHFCTDASHGAAFIALVDTARVEGTSTDAELIRRIYEKLSGGSALLPAAVGFSFDREGRTEQEMQNLSRSSKNVVRFIPRRVFENYLVHPDAIASILEAELQAQPGTSLADTVAEWLSKHGAEFLPKSASKTRVLTDQWYRDVHGAKLLNALFLALTGSKVEYSKTRHGAQLTSWLLESAPDQLRELGDYLEVCLRPTTGSS